MKEGPHLRIPHRILRNPLFSKWMGTAEGKVWLCLVPNVIRSSMENQRLNMIFNKYYLDKGLLTACFRQKDMAQFLGLKAKSQISKLLTNMANQNIITIHNDIWNGKQLKVYELGYLGEPPDRNEKWHLFIQMNKQLATKMLERLT